MAAENEGDMIKLPESELEVMLILWEKNGEEMSVNEVWEALDKQKKITMGALHSYLNRLEEKGFLAFRKEGKYKILRPLVKKEDYMEQEGEMLLGRFFGGSVGKFVNCLYDKNRLSAEDIRELKRFVEEFEEKPQ